MSAWGKWAWKMNWCKRNGVSPTNDKCWNLAEVEYQKEKETHETHTKQEQHHG